MRKIIPLIIVSLFFLSSFSIIGNCKSFQAIDMKNDTIESFIKILSFPDFEIIESNGQHTIEMNSCSYLLDQGKPMLPSKNILFALPPNSVRESVEITGLNLIQIPGFYNIKPVSKIIPTCPKIGYENYFEDIDKKWNDNYELTYLSDKPFPDTVGELVGQGTFHKISYISISLYPFVYHPVSGRLFLYDSVKIKVNYRYKNNENLRYDSGIDNKASKLFINYNDMKNMYELSCISSLPDNYNYVIITSNDLYNSILSSNFINWKSNLGFTIKVVNISDSLITSQHGFDLAEKIRNFLREYYANWGIEYVLFIGNYNNIPMRYCYPNRNNHNFNLSDVFGGEFPTDSYYADLSYSDSESWDSDGDGYYGEYRDDNPDSLAEISIGRIPTNDANKVVYTLEKIIAFEQDTGEWKNNVLHAGAIILFHPFDDGAVAMDNIEKDFMSGMTISHYCEKEGLKKSEYSWNELKEETFTNDWKTGKYGIVNWAAHGWSNVALRRLWLNDEDGDGKADEDELVWKDVVSVDSVLDDDYPSIIFTISCMIGYPEPSPTDWPDHRKGNLGVDLLTKPSFGASVSILCGTRITFLTPEYVNDHICYRFNQNLIINHESVGNAFHNAKFDYFQNTNAPGTWKFSNMFSYNLYGDPSLEYEGISVEGKPEKPVISGPESGKAGEEYTFSASSIDPNNDNLYYYFNWGDGTNSNWLGPYVSGTECSELHTWSKKGDYELKVRVKNTNGYFSEWSDPYAISMPYNKLIIRNIFSSYVNQHILLDKLQKIFYKIC